MLSYACVPVVKLPHPVDLYVYTINSFRNFIFLLLDKKFSQFACCFYSTHTIPQDYTHKPFPGRKNV